MERDGFLAPESLAEVQTAYEEVGSAAETVTREVARATAFDREEFDARVTGDVVATAHDALFASLLAVRVGSREEFEEWRADAEHDVVVVGNENVDRVAWHVAPFADRAVAATFADERDAAVATLRRQAFGRIYREALEDG